MFKLLSIAFILALTKPGSTFFFGSSSSNCGGCAPAAPAPCASPCASVPQASYPVAAPSPCSGGGCKAHGVNTASLSSTNDMEMRAALFGGLNLNNPAPITNELFFNNDGQSQIVDTQETIDGHKIRYDGVRRAPELPLTQPEDKVIELEDNNVKCNSKDLLGIMNANMKEDPRKSKRDINKAAEEFFKQPIDVICSRGHFSYIFSSDLFCESTTGTMTCIAFQQMKH
uniref:Ground-like domain-containing protein n=1 Tax=Rhabditophanes sp. KR3021 TaxID=114890 RepID=A0AC35TJP7_9BILA